MNNNERALGPILEILANKINSKQFVTDKSGVKMVEIIAAFIPFDPRQQFFNFGDKKSNQEYIKREFEWYARQSLFVDDIPGETPDIWKKVASKKGEINSNYGYLIYSKENGEQYKNCLKELKNNRESRRAIMIYTRPSIQTEYKRDGMSDFICTNTVQYFIRNDKLYSIVTMRSNDIIFGLLNDYAWQVEVMNQLLKDVQEVYPKVQIGELIWQAGSLHCYERHFPTLINMYNYFIKEFYKE